MHKQHLGKCLAPSDLLRERRGRVGGRKTEVPPAVDQAGPGPWPYCEWRRLRQSVPTTWTPSVEGLCRELPGLVSLSAGSKKYTQIM